MVADSHQLWDVVECERHPLARRDRSRGTIDRFTDNGELVERRLEQALLHHAVDDRDQNQQ